MSELWCDCHRTEKMHEMLSRTVDGELELHTDLIFKIIYKHQNFVVLHKERRVDRCLIPIEPIRIKPVFITLHSLTEMHYAIKDYLARRDSSKSPHKKGGSVFFTSRNVPITAIWIGEAFTKFAKYSQV